MACRKNIGAAIAPGLVRDFMSAPAIHIKSLIQYGFIAFPVAFAGFPLYVLAPDFYATKHGLSLSLLGVLLLFLRLFDAVQDPLIGYIADKWRGSFLTIVFVSGFFLCISVFGLFNGMFFSPAFWFGVCMLFAVSAYSVLTIIMGAQATLWTSDKDDQTRIAGARESFGLVGLVVAVCAPAILSMFAENDGVYLWYCLILSVLMVMGVFFFSKISLQLPVDKPNKQNTIQSILLAFRSLPKESLMLFSVYGVSMLASSVPAVLVVFYVRDLLGAPQLIGLFMLLYFLSGAMAMPVWKKLSVRHGKYKAWGISNVLAVAGFIGAFFLGSGDVWAYAVVCIFSGFALGADLTLPPSILADQIHASGNSRFSATHYAILTFISKASLALASAITFLSLDAAKFKPQAVNSEASLFILSASYSLVPCFLKLSSAALLYVLFIRHQSGGNNENNQVRRNNRSSSHA